MLVFRVLFWFVRYVEVVFFGVVCIDGTGDLLFFYFRFFGSLGGLGDIGFCKICEGK